MTGDLPLYGPEWDEIAADWKRRAKDAWLRYGDEGLRDARRRNRAAAYVYLRDLARRGVKSPDPATERLLAMLRRERR